LPVGYNYDEDEQINSFHKIKFKVVYPKVKNEEMKSLIKQLEQYEDMNEINNLNKV
jgi:hypothetical protein